MADPSRVFIAEDGSEIPVTWANLQAGKVPWSELDDDELGRGKLKDKNGTFTGRPSNSVPRDLVQELTRRLKERYDAKLREQLSNAQGVFFEIMNDSSVDPQHRLRASQYVQERLLGKVPDKLEVQAEVKPWEKNIEDVLTDLPD